jgi:hypothetical protein
VERLFCKPTISLLVRVELDQLSAYSLFVQDPVEALELRRGEEVLYLR